MKLYPAIDIQEGQAVRLRRGDFSRPSVFADDPLALALQWQEEGAEALHVVDLDGAREGRLVHFDLVGAITERASIPVQYGGGVRSAAALERVAASKVAWLVIGTGAITDRELLDVAVADLGDRLVVGVDSEHGLVATHGWQQRSEMSAIHFVHLLEDRGVKRVVYTDVLRDGMLEGPNLEGVAELAAATTCEIIVSGGVSSLDDLRRIRRLAAPHVVGVIVGRALYEGAFTLAEAQAALA